MWDGQFQNEFHHITHMSLLTYFPMFDGPRVQQEALDSVLGAAYSVSLWTTWSMQDDDMESPSCSRNRSHQKSGVVPFQ